MTETAVASAKATKDENKSSKRVLDPLERLSEILFGVIMVLTFTVSLRVARADRAQVREMLIGALGCNLAWGLIDAIMYLMSCVSVRGHNFAILRKLHRAPQPEEANQIIADELPPVVVAALPAGALDGMRQNLIKLTDMPPRPKLTRDDWRGAVGVFLLVFLSTFPIVIPFVITHDIKVAGRVSDVIGLVMLFLPDTPTGAMPGTVPGVGGCRWSQSAAR